MKEPVALGPLLTDARRGLAIQQHPITDPDIRVPIPAPIVQQMLLFAHRHYRALTWQPDNLVRIKTFRAIFVFCTKYCYFLLSGNRRTVPHRRHHGRPNGR
jgi:hypothetical protein